MKNIFPYGLSEPLHLDRVELFVIPGVFALVQYHGQPNSDSGISVPIGYMTREIERINQIELLLKSRLSDLNKLKITWGNNGDNKSNIVTQDLLPQDWLNNKISRKSTRTILSLNR